MGRVLLHDDDALLQRVLLVHLALQLTVHRLVRRVRVLTGAHAHRGVLEQRDGARQVRDHLGRELALTSHRVRQLASVLLHIVDVRLNLRAQLLQVLHNGALHGLGQVRVLVRDHARLVADVVEDVLHTVLTKELVTLTQGHLDHTAELGHLLGGVVLNVGDTLKVRNELLGDVLPACIC